MRKETNNDAVRPSVKIEPLLLRREDAANVLGVSVRKLDEWVASGLIAKWKIGGVVRFSVDELRLFVQSNG